ncbi:nuclease-related domain-containing protein [Herbiconiux sp. L3-i23]|uniref:nuclease-related domain-containing protein n=1 Tax=Herbiconiux sp. L3-i23 TaxID=2905871 RepID=UPI00204F15A6|nr:nuclease-related domain-containing protein [Herbiconiux sp. L3-i23]BDI22162.1 hypothetical protein L3i23_09380 [Herbiconiux sp. L3-i23]
MSESDIALVRPGLRSRPAAYSVIDRCLAIQNEAVPRGWLARQLGASPLAPDARAWFAGAVGELEVARLLDGLDERWTVLHSVPVGKKGADVDHLLIGPAGVFPINTKAVRGSVWVGRARILVDGHRENFVAKSEAEARRVHRALSDATGASLFVRPVLVFVDPRRMTVRELPSSVTVLQADDLLPWLSDQEELYPASRVAELVDAADRETTWHFPGGPAVDVRRQLQRFERLRAEVREADRRRRSARLAGALLCVAAVMTTVAIVLPALLLELVDSVMR